MPFVSPPGLLLPAPVKSVLPPGKWEEAKARLCRSLIVHPSKALLWMMHQITSQLSHCNYRDTCRSLHMSSLTFTPASRNQCCMFTVIRIIRNSSSVDGALMEVHRHLQHHCRLACCSVAHNALRLCVYVWTRSRRFVCIHEQK